MESLAPALTMTRGSSFSLSWLTPSVLPLAYSV